MDFKSEIERLKHPQVGLIPKSLWRDVQLFNQEISPEQLCLMLTPLSTLLAKPLELNSYSNKNAAWICIISAHSAAEPQQIQQVTDILDVNLAQSLIYAAALGQFTYIQNQINNATDINKKTLIQANDYQIFVEACRNGHKSILKFLFDLYPNLTQTIIENNQFELYGLAARYGHEEIMEYLESLAPDKIKDMIKAHEYDAYYNAAKNNHLHIITHIEQAAPELIGEMISINDFQVYRTACSHGNLPILTHLESIAGTNLIDMVSASDFLGYSLAAERNHYDVMIHLEKTFPNLVPNMVRGNQFYAYKWAVHSASMDIVTHIEERAEDLLEEMVKDDDFLCYRRAASGGRTLMLNHIEQKAPHLVPAMLSADNFGALRWAIESQRWTTVEHLLSHPLCLAFAEENEAEYSDLVHAYIEKCISLLKVEENPITTKFLTELFNISHDNDAKTYFYMARNLIRRSDPNLLEGLRLILSIPEVRSIAHTPVTANKPNELLRVAIANNNHEAITYLLSIPEVRQEAIEHNFYENEMTIDSDIQTLEKYYETAVLALNPHEKSSLTKVLYQSDWRQLTQLMHKIDDYKANLMQKIANLGLNNSWIARAILYIAQIPLWQKVLAGLIMVIPAILTGIYFTVGIAFGLTLAVFFIDSCAIILSQLYENHYHYKIQELKQEISRINEDIESIVDTVDELFPNLVSHLEMSIEEHHKSTHASTVEEFIRFKNELCTVADQLHKLSDNLSLGLTNDATNGYDINLELHSLTQQYNRFRIQLDLLKTQYRVHHVTLKNQGSITNFAARSQSENKYTKSISALSCCGLFANREDSNEDDMPPSPSTLIMST